MIANEIVDKYGFKNDGKLLRLRTDKATVAPKQWVDAASSIDVDTICGFVNLYLLNRFDNPLPIAPIHKLLWELGISHAKYVAVAAPRGISKSTSISLVFVLVLLLFRLKRFVILISSVETLAAAFIETVRTELMENPDLKNEFRIVGFQKDNETDLVVEFSDGYTCCVRGRGFDQKFRGITWRGMRPGAVIGDDMEDDEAVESPARRKKNLDKIMRAIIPCGSDTCIYRIVGTVIHLDSVLNRLLHNPNWVTMTSQAQSDAGDKLLWEDKLSFETLKEIRSNYEAVGDIEGFYKEYYNRPVSDDSAFFRRSDFLPMGESDHKKDKIYFAGMDFAISETQTADYTVIVVGGMDSNGIVHIVDVIRERFGSDMIIEEMIRVQRRYKIDIFTVERGQIEKAIGPFLNVEMIKEGNALINLNKVTPTKSKVSRAKSVQMMMRAGGLRFDIEADWYKPFYDELMTVSNSGPKGDHDDQFDAFAYLGLSLDMYREGRSEDEVQADMDAGRKEFSYDDDDAPIADTTEELCYVSGY